jgi:hypothetical protein
MDGNESWESRFLRLQGAGIHPDTKSAPRGAANPRAKPSQTSSDGFADGDAARANRLLAELARYDVFVIDNRAKGGAIWAYPNNEPFHGHAQLRRLGMKFKAEKKGFYWP